MKKKIVNCLEEDLLRIEWDKNEALRMQHELITEPAEAIFDLLMETKLKDEKRKAELEVSLQPLINYLQEEIKMLCGVLKENYKEDVMAKQYYRGKLNGFQDALDEVNLLLKT